MKTQIPLLLILALSLNCLSISAYDELLTAMQKNDLDKFKQVLNEQPARAHQKLKTREYPPLLEAIGLFRPEMIKILLERGVKVNIQDKEKETPVFKVVRTQLRHEKRLKQVTELLDIMVRHKVNLNAYNAENETPLHLAVGKSAGKTLPLKLQLIEYLIAHGADPKLRKKGSQPLLMRAMSQLQKDESCQENAMATIKLLVAKGADVNAAENDGDTALIRIIKTECFTPDQKKELIKLLVENGARIHQKNDRKESPKKLVDRKSPLYRALTKTKKKR